MKKILTVDVKKLLRNEEFCIDVRDEQNHKETGRHVEILGPSKMVYDGSRREGARVWVETSARVLVDTKDQVKEIA